MKFTKLFVLACAAFVGVSGVALAGDDALAPRQVPAKVLPMPADVSPELQKLIAAPYNPAWNVLWTTGEQWRVAANAQAAKVMQTQPAMRERLGVTVLPNTINGVRVYVVTPDVIPPDHHDKVLIHIHGGCYELYPGEAGTNEAVIMAGLGHYKVISVDYRMPPEGYFPAALDDVETVYKAVLRANDAKNVGVFGTSAGGALVLELMLRAKQEGLQMPGAIAPGTPMSDLTKTGDSFYTNEKVDNVLVSRDGFCDAAAVVYAHGHDLKDPLLSPVYGDMHGFPPAILTTGTRDLLLSNTIRVHRKLREAGIDAQLEVFDGMSHAQYQMDDRIPETKEAFGEITEFFNKHLGH
ncbi:alpha/beta hydrolase [Paraburkholderia sp. 40]|uniref:alpha/beta hydrolase n=1 Tax=Paraburkholderia sp. 40 TaxID=2991059 RepID=UPI003D1BB472